MLYFFTPYSTERNLGKAYNQYMALLPNDNDWAVLLDGDTMFLTSDFGTHIQEIVDLYPHAGIITCITNRIGNVNQRYQGRINEDGEMRNHRAIALDQQKKHRHFVTKCGGVISGHLMVIQKKTWNEIKFSETVGILGVDTDYSQRILDAGKKIYIMQGLYLLHYYRLVEGRKHKEHLK